MNTDDEYSPSGDQDSSPRRRLPIPPRTDRLHSRPLPKIPRALACKQCRTCITSSNALLPPSAIPPLSRTFRGYSGKASLFMETYNVKLSHPGVQLMATGAHTMQEITCSTCSQYLGWKILRAHEPSEKWKEGNSLLELAHLEHDSNAHVAHNRKHISTSSDSDSSWDARSA